MSNVKDVPMVIEVLFYFAMYGANLANAECNWRTDSHVTAIFFRMAEKNLGQKT